jgi:hypothetical protein
MTQYRWVPDEESPDGTRWEYEDIQGGYQGRVFRPRGHSLVSGCFWYGSNRTEASFSTMRMAADWVQGRLAEPKSPTGE